MTTSRGGRPRGRPSRRRNSRQPVWTIGGITAVVVLVLGLLGMTHALTGSSVGNQQPVAATESNGPEISHGAIVLTADTCPTWAENGKPSTNGKWDQKGYLALSAANTDTKARKALVGWLYGIRNVPSELSGAAKDFLGTAPDPDTLYDNDGCASTSAVKLFARIYEVIGKSTVRPGFAPANGYNSGVSSDGSVFTEPGVSGYASRAGVQVEVQQTLNPKSGIYTAGSYSEMVNVWVMGRCGNPVTQGPGPTEAAPKPRPVTSPPPQASPSHSPIPSSSPSSSPSTSPSTSPSSSPSPSTSTTTPPASSSPSPSPSTSTSTSPPASPSPSTSTTTPPASPSPSPSTSSPPPTPQAPVIVNVTYINDVYQGEQTNNFCIEYQIAAGDSGSITLSSHFGSFGQNEWTGLTGQGQVCTYYQAMLDPTTTTDATDQVTASIIDTNTDESALGYSNVFTVHPPAVHP